MKKIISVLMIAAASLALVNCGGGSTAVTAVTPVAIKSINAITGVATKGPFQQNSMVVATQLNTDGTPGAGSTTAVVTDNLGSYNLPNVTWGGLTEVKITGFYFDEVTNAVSLTQATLSAIVDLPAITSGTTQQVTKAVANPNIASTIAAGVAKKSLASNAATGVTLSATSVLQSASASTAAALGLPAQDANGVAIDLSTLDLTKTADPALGVANQKLLAVSATLLDAVNNGAATDVTALAATLATDVTAGAALGTAASTAGAGAGAVNVTAILQTSQATTIANAATIANNLNAAVTTAAAAVIAAGGTTTAAADPALTASLGNAATASAAASATVLRGLIVPNNTFTIGAATYTIAAGGIATTGAQVPSNALAMNVTFADLTNAAGNGAKAAITPVILTFTVSSTTNSRTITGSVPAKVVTDGLGGVVVNTVGTLTYSGVGAAGLAVTPVAGASAATVITSAANSVTFNATALSNLIGVAITPDTYNFSINMTGVNIGMGNATGTAVSKLFSAGIHGAVNTI